jgi:hypothetical protein
LMLDVDRSGFRKCRERRQESLGKTREGNVLEEGRMVPHR